MVAAGTGCSQAREWTTQARRWVGKPTARSLATVGAPSASAEIDEVSHAINRLTFGARPGEVARIEQMGLAKWFEMQLQR